MINTPASIFSSKWPFYRRVMKITRQVCDAESNCIIIGAGRGKTSDIILDAAPRGNHYLFEPNPRLLDQLKQRYINYNCNISTYILSDNVAEITRSYLHTVRIKNTQPGKKDIVKEQLTEFAVSTELLDNILPAGYVVTMVVIGIHRDILSVLQGAAKMISESKPDIIFEYGMGNDLTKNTEIFTLLAVSGLRISTPERWLHNRPCFTEAEFSTQTRNNPLQPLIAYP